MSFPSNERALQRYDEDVKSFLNIPGLSQYFMSKVPGISDYYKALSYDALDNLKHCVPWRNATADNPEGIPTSLMTGQGNPLRVLEVPHGTWAFGAQSEIPNLDYWSAQQTGCVPLADGTRLAIHGAGRGRTILKHSDITAMFFAQGAGDLYLRDLTIEGPDDVANYGDLVYGVYARGCGFNIFLDNVEMLNHQIAIRTGVLTPPGFYNAVSAGDPAAWTANTRYQLGDLVHGISTGAIAVEFPVGPFGLDKSVYDVYQCVVGGVSSSTYYGLTPQGPYGRGSYQCDALASNSPVRWRWVGYRPRLQNHAYVAGDHMTYTNGATYLCVQGGTTANTPTTTVGLSLATDYTDNTVKWRYAALGANITVNNCILSARGITILQGESMIPESCMNFVRDSKLSISQDRFTWDKLENRDTSWTARSSLNSTGVNVNDLVKYSNGMLARVLTAGTLSSSAPTVHDPVSIGYDKRSTHISDGTATLVAWGTTDDLDTNLGVIHYLGPVCPMVSVGNEYFNANSEAIQHFTSASNLGPSQGAIIANNVFHHCTNAIALSGELMDLGDPYGTRAGGADLVINNIFRDIPGYCVQPYSGHVSIKGNRFMWLARDSSTAQPVAIGGGDNGGFGSAKIDILDNDFSSFLGLACIRLTPGSSSPIRIEGNTFGNGLAGGTIGAIYLQHSYGTLSPHITIKHNTFLGTSGYSKHLLIDGACRVFHDHNLYIGARPTSITAARGNVEMHYGGNDVFYGTAIHSVTEHASNLIKLFAPNGLGQFLAADGSAISYTIGFGVNATAASGANIKSYCGVGKDGRTIALADTANQTITIAPNADLYTLDETAFTAPRAIQKMFIIGVDTTRLHGGAVVYLLVNTQTSFSTGGGVGGFAAAISAPATATLMAFRFNAGDNLWYRV